MNAARRLITAIAVALPCGLAFAQPASTPASAAAAGADRAFANQAAMGGAAEVEAGRLAQEKGANAAVKQFGARMVEDHGKAGAELKQIADAKSITLPNAPDATHQSAMQRLQKLSGAGFDHAFMQMMVRDHEKVVAAFDKEAKSGKDPELKAFAAKTLPTLRTHLQMARELNTGAGAVSAASR